MSLEDEGPSVIVTFIAVSSRDVARVGKTDDAPWVELYYLRNAWEMAIGQFILFLQHAH